MTFIKNSTAKSILALSFAFILSVAITTVVPTDTAQAQWVDGGDVCTSCGADSWGDWSSTGDSWGDSSSTGDGWGDWSSTDDSWSDWGSTGDSWSDWSTTDDSWSDWSSTNDGWGDWSTTDDSWGTPSSTSDGWGDWASTTSGEWYDIAESTPVGEWYDIAESTPTGEWYDIAVATPTYTHRTPTYTYGGNATYNYNSKFNLELHKGYNHIAKKTPTTHNHNTHNHGSTSNPVNITNVNNNNVNNSTPVAYAQPVARYAYPTVYPSYQPNVTVAQTRYTPAYDYVNINQVPYTGTKEVGYVLTLIAAALASIAAAVFFKGRMNFAFAGTPVTLQEETVEEVETKEDSDLTLEVENGEDGPKLSFK